MKRFIRKRIRFILIVAIVALGCFSIVAEPSHLTDTSLTTAKKTRVVKIYLYENPNENRPEIPGRLVAVKRRIFDYEPLYGTMQSLAAGEIESDNTREWHRIVGTVYAELVSARIRNGTAEINFKYELDADSERRWEEDLLNSHFTEAATRTARQFKEVKQVSICVNGIKNYTDLDRTRQVKCPFEMFSAPRPRPIEPNEMWTVEIELNKTDAPTTIDGTRRLTVPVNRRIKAADYLNETFKALIAGETAAERKTGYSTSTYGARFDSLNVKGGKAFVRFKMPPGAKFPEKQSAHALSSAVYSAVFQFFIFDKIEVCIDEVRNLEDVMEKGAPPLPCEDVSKID